MNSIWFDIAFWVSSLLFTAGIVIMAYRISKNIRGDK